MLFEIMMTCSLLTLKGGKLIFQLGKYSTSPFWHDPDVKAEAVIAEFSKFDNEK
jgi:hypothetical protein